MSYKKEVEELVNANIYNIKEERITVNGKQELINIQTLMNMEEVQEQQQY